jgi:bifunctional ADP-heptose synthase (sugar kinase/adenylyltransferase)
MPERSRAEMLLALRVVDFVHIVSEAGSSAFLDELRPDVHVDGAEHGDDSATLAGVCDFTGTMHPVRSLSEHPLGEAELGSH